jgi:pantoate--beta-alanine ligase
MEIIREIAAMTAWSKQQAAAGKAIGLVPTMGYFHEGHLSLMRLAGKQADKVVVSLFVNPAQFGPTEDLSSYPRDFERDRELASQAGADVLFAPAAEAMYPKAAKTTISVRGLTDYLCGADRPDHFAGVTTVVSKLFNIVRPDLAVFGQKDFQQLVVVRRMCIDLNIGVEIIDHPIVREADGLAMSSRNTYLTESLRESALSLSKSIALVRKRVVAGERDVAELGGKVRMLIDSYADTRVDYISFVHQETLEPVNSVDENTVLALAVRVGDTVRLIDNGFLIEQSNAEL